MIIKDLKNNYYIMNLWEQIKGGFWYEAFFYILFLVITGIAGWIFRKEIIQQIRKLSFKLLNKPVRIKAIYVQKYKNPPKNWLSNDIFKKIKQIQTDQITKRAINSKSMKIESKNLGTSLLIELNEEFDSSTIGTKQPKILNYNVNVKMENEVRLGLRDIEDLQDFVTLAEKIQDVVRNNCFLEDEIPYQKFVACDIKRNFKTLFEGKKKIIDKKLKAEISLIDDRDIKIISEEPSYLVRTVKKYFTI